MFKISKQFELCYMHRVWTQKLDEVLSGGDKQHCPCKVCHGHNSLITVELEGENLNAEGMLVDYVNLTFFKKFIDKELDHKTILDINDPWTLDFVNSTRLGEHRVDKVQWLNNGIYSTTTTNSPHQYHHDIITGLVAVPFVPTSENICKWLHQIVEAKIGNLCKVSSVSFSETPKTLATYYK